MAEQGGENAVKKEKKPAKRVKGVVIRWSAAVLITLLSLAVLFAARSSTAFADWFGDYVYPVFSGIGARLWGLFPFSAGEFFVILFVTAVLVGIVLLVIFVIRGKGHRLLTLFGGLSYGGIAAAVLFLLMTFNCLVNYSRTPFSAYSGLTLRTYSKEELEEYTEYLITQANQCAEKVRLDENGRAIKPEEFDRLAIEAMEKQGQKYPVLDTYYPKPKAVVFSSVMSAFDTAGIYFPITVEANYNQAMPVSSQGFTACHELSHLSGFIREDEANFIAFIACRDSGDEYFRYSGYLGALTYALNAYSSVASREEYYQMYEMISPVIKAEFAYRNEYWAQYREKDTYKAAAAVNDAYLQANGQTDGSRSYGRVVDLLLAEYYGE